MKEEHPAITDHKIIGHSDVAPLRKTDPGHFFPWALLHEKGHGLLSSKTVESPATLYKFGESSESIRELKEALHAFGYQQIEDTPGFDMEMAEVVRVFHMHFNPTIES